MRFLLFFLTICLYAFSLQANVFMTPPKGWQCIEDPSQLPKKILRIYVGPAKGNFTPSINIAFEETELGFDEYVKLAKSYHENQTQAKCTSMGKIETKSGIAHLMQIDTMTQWGNVRFLQAILLQGPSAYVITATCLQEQFHTFSSQFVKALQTFSIDANSTMPQ